MPLTRPSISKYSRGTRRAAEAGGGRRTSDRGTAYATALTSVAGMQIGIDGIGLSRIVTIDCTLDSTLSAAVYRRWLRFG